MNAMQRTKLAQVLEANEASLRDMADQLEEAQAKIAHYELRDRCTKLAANLASRGYVKMAEQEEAVEKLMSAPLDKLAAMEAAMELQSPNPYSGYESGLPTGASPGSYSGAPASQSMAQLDAWVQGMFSLPTSQTYLQCGEWNIMPLLYQNNYEPVDDQLRGITDCEPPADIQLTDPSNALAFWDGEWITFDSSGKIVRACNVGSAGNAATARLSYMLASAQGMTDVQSSPEKKLAYIVGPQGMRFWTRVWKGDTVGSGVAISSSTAAGVPLKVASISLTTPRGTRIVSGLVGHGGEGTDTHNIVGRVIRVVGEKLLFQLGKLPTAQPTTYQEKRMSTPFGSDLADRLSTPDGISKFADLSGKVIMDRLREIAWSSPLLNMRPISPDECQISENSDTFTKVEFMEPNSRAMTINFRADSKVNIIHADRAFMAFYTIASEVFQKREQELQIYRSIPVSQILEQNTLKDMQEIRDHGFLTYAELAVQALQQEANGGSVTTLNATALQSGTPPVEFSVVKGELARSSAVDNAYAHFIQRPDIVALKKLLSANRLEGAVMLISAPDLDGVDAWTLEDNGDRVQSDTVTEGFKANKLLGLKIIKTIKTDILRPGNVWLFTAPQFLGRAYLLNKTKFYVDKRFNVISWQAWEDLGMLLLNIASAKKLELYSGDATSNDADGVRSLVMPKAERDLGQKNNRVAEGVRFPQVQAILSL